MKWNKHSQFEGKHAFMGASNYHWLGYDEDKIVDRYYAMQAKERGTQLHAFAEQCIRLGQKLPRSEKTLNMYVNDAIGYRMDPEVLLFYSPNCFGTADTICFRKNFLRIHDYKSGETPAKMDQLLIYEAIFCLEYKIKPSSIESELRIYQNDNIVYYTPEPPEILDICDKIITFDRRLTQVQFEEG